MKYLPALLWLIPAGLCLMTIAQPTTELQARYPGERAVLLDHTLHYTITVKDGQPQVQSQESQRILYLSVPTGSEVSQYGFYHSAFHEVQQFSAYTLTANSKKVRVTDFRTTDSKSNGIFYDDVKETTFDFPAVSPGSIGTLETAITEKNPHLLTPFYFGLSIPVVRSELRITFPRTMSVKYLLKGMDSSKIAFGEETHHGEITYTFTASDMPSEKAYDDAPGRAWYATHLIFYIEKYADGQGRTINYLSDPNDLYHLYLGYLKGINKEAGPELRHIVDSLCRDAPTDEQKARNVYGWVQQHIKYIAFEQGMEGFIPRDANLVCSRRFGDCKDMSSILTMMLRTAGLDAWYTWIGTRDLPYTYTETPLPMVDNHMICTLRLHDQYLFLDGTDPYGIFGLPSIFTQGKQALVAVSDTGYQILTVPVIAKESNRLTDSTILDLTETGVKGRLAIDYTGYYASVTRDRLAYSDAREIDAEMKVSLRRGSDKFKLDSFHIADRSDNAHLRITGSFTLQDYARHLDNEWYINMNLFKFYEHEEIDYPKRRTPIAYRFRGASRYVVVLNLPAEYEAAYVPPGKNYRNAVWGFRMSYEKKGRQLVFIQEFDNDYLMLQPDQFADWNKVLENLFPLYRTTVSLQKKP